MTKTVTFRDNPDLDMGRYQVPGYTGHFPTKGSYEGMSMGKASKEALAKGGYFDHDIPHSVVENNREDPEVVRAKQDHRDDAQEYFNHHKHMQGGKPVYQDGMLPGYTGHIPGMGDSTIGRTYRRGALEGTLEFKRIQAGIPRYRFPLTVPPTMQPIGGREMCVKGNVDRDEVPIDDLVPLWTPRYMGHHHDEIMKTFYPREHCYPGFPFREDRHRKKPVDGAGTCSIFRNIHMDRDCSSRHGPLLHYHPKILPPPEHPDSFPVEVKLDQPKKMSIVVPMPTWQPSTAKKLIGFYNAHAKSGFSGFVPNTRNVLGSSMNREVVEEHQRHLKRQD